MINVKNKALIGDVARESGTQQKIAEGSVQVPTVSSFQKSEAKGAGPVAQEVRVPCF